VMATCAWMVWGAVTGWNGRKLDDGRWKGAHRNLQVMRLIAAIYESAQTGHIVCL
jgi:hypothetical protein